LSDTLKADRLCRQQGRMCHGRARHEEGRGHRRWLIRAWHRELPHQWRRGARADVRTGRREWDSNASATPSSIVHTRRAST